VNFGSILGFEFWEFGITCYSFDQWARSEIGGVQVLKVEPKAFKRKPSMESRWRLLSS